MRNGEQRTKANLRAAVDELMRECQAGDYLFYWPSYEIVTVFSRQIPPDRRHKPDILEFIMMLFEKNCVVSDESPLQTPLCSVSKARVADGTYDVDVAEAGGRARRCGKKVKPISIDAGFPEVAEPGPERKRNC